MLIAYRARDIAEAHIVSGMLHAEGIESHVGGHYLQGAMGEIGAAGFTNVHVEDDDYPRARELVKEYEDNRPGHLPVLAYVAVFPSILAYMGWNYGVQVIGPGRAGMFMYLMPLFTAALAVPLLGEALRSYHAVGAVLILLGLYLASWQPRRATR